METIDNLPSSPLGVMRQFSISKTGIDVFSDGLIESVTEGELNALELRAMVKALEMILERVNKATQENQLTAANLFPGNDFEAYGVKFTKGDVHTKYDYSTCGDPVWEKLTTIALQAAEQVKQREAFLRAVKAPFSLLDEGTGEVSVISPPNVSRVPGLKVSVK